MNEESFLSYYKAKRNTDSHKGDYGRVYIVAGSEGMTGAAMLCAESALRTGAGLVYLFAPGKLLPIYEIACREAVKIKVGDEEDCFFRQTHIRQIVDTISRFSEKSVVVIGPGLGLNNETKSFIRLLLSELSALDLPVILDADGLNSLKGRADLLKEYYSEKKEKKLIITPHTAELSRLIKKDVDHINKNRSNCACEASHFTGAITVLKGNRTVVAETLREGNSQIYINESGNPGMATGGSGDVLSGILAGIIASHDCRMDVSLYFLVCTAVYIHGLCGDIATAKYGERAVKAGDLTDMLKEVYCYGK